MKIILVGYGAMPTSSVLSEERGYKIEAIMVPEENTISTIMVLRNSGQMW